MTSVLAVVWALCMRDLLRFVRDRSQVLGAAARPLLWLVFLGAGMHRAFTTELGVGYGEFLLPGVVAMSLLFGGLFTSVTVIWDREFGFMKELAVAPIPRWSIVAGKIASGTLVTVLQGAIVLAFAPVASIDLPLAAIAPLLGLMTLTSVAVVALGLCIASRMRTFEGFGALANFVVLPLFFLSGSMYPLRDVPPYLAPLVTANPITYAVDAMRGVTLGRSVHSVAVDVAVLVAFAAATTGGAVALFRVSR
ncbi:MAG: ABC transporter permease [Deltaproteobacteria bacterium]|nr:ABC transporter permease [Deltaproteobacteria bacterium]